MHLSFGDILCLQDAPLEVNGLVKVSKTGSYQGGGGAALDWAGHGDAAVQEEVLGEGKGFISLEILAIQSDVKSDCLILSAL